MALYTVFTEGDPCQPQASLVFWFGGRRDERDKKEGLRTEGKGKFPKSMKDCRRKM